MAASTELKEKLKSKFIVLDGPDGCGKSTQQHLIADRLTAVGIEVTTVRDPGTTPAGEAIRTIVLSGRYGKLSPQCELLLFMAARAEMTAAKIMPAINAGHVVLADRFVSASCAYQGASGVNLASIIEMGTFAIRSTWPDLTIILDIPVELGTKRLAATARQAGLDAMERRSRAFHEKVREIFLTLPQAYPAHVQVVHADGSVQQVTDRIMEALERVDF